MTVAAADAFPYCLLPTAYCLLPTAYCLLPTAYCLPPPHLRRLCRLSPPECPQLPPEACVLPDGALPNPVNE
ncbi:hypothetical protein FP026_02080 [Rhizobium tropici]|uniref:Uncharacterized protein n=1 Tax=Rhizobium tropici TaxID=398 RepID=A0A5B0WFI0_RHITR|nr:hypothetical protein FP026_02080 [Rhizobium tropici]